MRRLWTIKTPGQVRREDLDGSQTKTTPPEVRMDDSKKGSRRTIRALASPAALTVLFGAFASNAATLKPVVNDTIGVSNVSFPTTEVQQQQQQQQQQVVKPGTMASGKPVMLQSLVADLGLA
ncbi:hypothetical protein MXAN_0694 [Myxococcus xanthus DK 1622]|uniref:Uncharacterized protein n=3 Tax=Myxococcus TaxID=32 RepID=Q1DEG1_MYXXD|nr:hypothetical protein MXAN_0694 [Myxococcus xanthus DK 1622]NOJ55411.1 hypothetical protein [Myxococcus xanthus]QVW69439.1 hypothetical protein JTM82_07800 [Myxococcus xanthus DZ2]QLH55567.1 hypothetical protein [Myxococcus xanthus DK 1622]QPM80376.1 hypothetical protein I5Q59_03510 [Myxococcus xanthus]